MNCWPYKCGDLAPWALLSPVPSPSPTLGKMKVWESACTSETHLLCHICEKTETESDFINRKKAISKGHWHKQVYRMVYSHFLLGPLLLRGTHKLRIQADFPGGLVAKNPLPAKQEMRVLGSGGSPEKGMTTHASILTWEIPHGQKCPAGYSSWGHNESDTT